MATLLVDCVTGHCMFQNTAACFEHHPFSSPTRPNHLRPCLQVKGATYDCKAVRNLMRLGAKVLQTGSRLVIDITVPP